MSYEYAIIVKNKTRLEALIERFNTKAQAQFYIERSGGSFLDYVEEHEVFYQQLSFLQSQLSSRIKNKLLERQYIPSFLFHEKQLLVVIGQDGLVANAAKYSNNCPIIAVNPDPKRYDGVLLPFHTGNFMNALEGVLSNSCKIKTVPFAQAQLNDGQRLLAFNDLFIGAATHVSARYRISYESAVEEHSSSGIIVATPAGATGWMSSVFNMVQSISGINNNKKSKRPQWKSSELFFAVREPFLSQKTGVSIQHGKINPQRMLTIESLMPSNGIIFSDGMESDFLAFNSGAIATISIARETAQLVVGNL